MGVLLGDGFLGTITIGGGGTGIELETVTGWAPGRMVGERPTARDNSHLPVAGAETEKSNFLKTRIALTFPFGDNDS
jgi:hypothetical protein